MKLLGDEAMESEHSTGSHFTVFRVCEVQDMIMCIFLFIMTSKYAIKLATRQWYQLCFPFLP